MIDNLQKNSRYNILKRLLKHYIMPYKLQLAIALMCGIVGVTCSTFIVKSVKPIIDEVLIAKDRKMLVIVPLMLLGLYSLKGIADYGLTYLIRYMGQRMLTNLQMQMYSHLLHADYKFIQNQSSGRLISRFTNDIMIMRASVSHLLASIMQYSLLVIALFIFMLQLDFYLSMIVFVAFPKCTPNCIRRVKVEMPRDSLMLANLTSVQV